MYYLTCWRYQINSNNLHSQNGFLLVFGVQFRKHIKKRAWCIEFVTFVSFRYVKLILYLN